MYSLTDKQTIEYLCRKYGFRLKKALGQNFINDDSVLAQIADHTESDCVLEIGPGIGALTAALAQKSEKVLSVEIDSSLLPVLEETLAGFDNIKIINDDILNLDLPHLLKEEFGDKKVTVAANLPYYITTPIIMALIEKKLPLSDIIIMVQKEVAERIVSAPGKKSYGALTLAVNYYCSPQIICEVPRSKFTPAPDVDSAVIRLKVLDSPSVSADAPKKFFALVKAAFAQRRKTLANALKNSGQFGSREDIMSALTAVGIAEMARGETLSIEKFAELSNYFVKTIAK